MYEDDDDSGGGGGNQDNNNKLIHELHIKSFLQKIQN